jgi:signal transduction histidine kinase
MIRLFTTRLSQLDAIYADRPFFDGVRARLLAVFIVLLSFYVPTNIVQMLWFHPQYYSFRIVVNLGMLGVAWYAMWKLFQGRLQLAGSLIALGAILPAHATVLLTLTHLGTHPVSLGFKAFVQDVIFLPGALMFAPRRLALALVAYIVAGHVIFFSIALQHVPIAGSLEDVAAVMLREGLVAILFLFGIGVTVVHLIETAHKRSEEALRQTRAMNDNLERLVAERTVALEQLNGELTAMNDEKNAFMGMAAHDLRNPAVKIRMITEILDAQGDYSETRVRADLAVIADTSTRMLGLLTNLLDINAIEEGRVALRPTSLDAHAILREVHGDFRARAAAKGIDFVLVAPPIDAPATLRVWVDAAAIRQVLENLVSNALKFSSPGKGVWLSVQAAPPGRVHFAVRDEGPGLSDADRFKLFSKFTRLSAQPTGGESSNGLGLSIVKRLVEALAGTIAAESEPGHGATFRVDFPATATDSRSPFALAPVGVAALAG